MSLLALQRNFQDWLTNESTDASARFGVQARAGLAVYLNNYRAQLMTCLAESFPAVRSWLGDPQFNATAATHIDRAPPHAWTLDAYASGFPETLDVLHPGQPHVGELARLELALAAAFVGPDAAAVDTTALGDVDWDGAIIVLAPTFVMLPVTTNVCAIWSAISAQEPVPMPQSLPEGSRIAVWRKQLTPSFRAVTSEEAVALGQARDGRCFGDICASLVQRMGEGPGIDAAGAMLAQWLAEGSIVRIRN